jgi:hypothetical protein
MRETFPACWPLTANGVKLSMRTTASPISRMDTSVEDGWRESSRPARRAPAPRRTRTRYSMTWSARPSTDGGIVSPRAFAVLRLIASSNVVARSTGRSFGFAPLKILSI